MDSLAALLPATVRMLLMTDTVLDGGSSATLVLPLGSGVITTVARFSFIESAETRAATTANIAPESSHE